MGDQIPKKGKKKNEREREKKKEISMVQIILYRLKINFLYAYTINNQFEINFFIGLIRNSE